MAVRSASEEQTGRTGNQGLYRQEGFSEFFIEIQQIKHKIHLFNQPHRASFLQQAVQAFRDSVLFINKERF
ncbi:hypothetical protein [Mixta intestinalis]|uniref:hypothetical protein n=1 Tax=Mixta intestinalis TaxID=1615494 RepID=UPI001370FB8C|nr:hypothetical protein [Mixta intestinalis]